MTRLATTKNGLQVNFARPSIKKQEIVITTLATRKKGILLMQFK